MKKAVPNLKITVVCDNDACRAGLESAWGFSCFIEGMEKNILFDTGHNPFLLLRNASRMKIKPKAVDSVFLSHAHWDHTGGLYGILERNQAVHVCLPDTFSRRYKENIRSLSKRMTEVKNRCRVLRNVYSTGQLGTSTKEQSLVIHSNRGTVVITGCAHPGIETIVKKAQEIVKDEILLLMGGFHLEAESTVQLKKIISHMRNIGVRYVMPCHCTGEKAKELFRREYDAFSIEGGAGRILYINDLK